MTNTKRLLTAAVLALTATFATAAFATESGGASQPAAATTTAAPLTKDQAIAMAQKAHPGKVIKAYEDTKKGKKTWEVKIQGDDGKKWEIHYDIKTGEQVSVESE